LVGLRPEQPVHYIVLEHCIAAVEAATVRRDRLEAHVEAALPDWSLTPIVRALQALRGMALVAAVTLIAELGEVTCFTDPRQFMSYLGLVPSEHSSGGTRRQGGITKAANGDARRTLIEVAWSYRFPTRTAETFHCFRKGHPRRFVTRPGRPRNGIVAVIVGLPKLGSCRP
jgi:transposase